MGNTQGVSNTSAAAASESKEKKQGQNHRGQIQAISVIHMKLRKLRHRRKQSRREKTFAQITTTKPASNLLKQDEVRDIQVSIHPDRVAEATFSFVLCLVKLIDFVCPETKVNQYKIVILRSWKTQNPDPHSMSECVVKK